MRLCRAACCPTLMRSSSIFSSPASLLSTLTNCRRVDAHALVKCVVARSMRHCLRRRGTQGGVWRC